MEIALVSEDSHTISLNPRPVISFNHRLSVYDFAAAVHKQKIDPRKGRRWQQKKN